jgi:hypothetical protein
MMTATMAENSHPTASIPALGFGVRAWRKSVIETSHAAASPSINKIARFFFDSFAQSLGVLSAMGQSQKPEGTRREARSWGRWRCL